MWRTWRSLVQVKTIQRLIGDEHNLLKNDNLLVRAVAGNGGTALARYNGIGGNGGSIYLVPTLSLSFNELFARLKQTNMTIRADSGKGNTKVQLVGDSAKDMYVPVPLGIDVVNDENRLLFRCTVLNKRYKLARGGIGASIHNKFQAEKGEDLSVELHLKLRPNVAFVGFPNSGKSTMLKAFVPKKKVKIGNYPFTTVNPQMAFWSGEEKNSLFTLSMVDLPGLIEGASRNRGKGHSFLKHILHADIIVLVIDCNGFQLKASLEEPYRTPLETIVLLNKEMLNYNKELIKKPVIVALNKIDIANDIQEVHGLVSLLQGDWCSSLSSSLRPSIPFHFHSVVLTSAARGEVSSLSSSILSLRHLIHDDSLLEPSARLLLNDPK